MESIVGTSLYSLLYTRTTKITRLTWHNFMYILQKYLKDPFSVYEAVPQSLGSV